jgi:hypothetical protein
MGAPYFLLELLCVQVRTLCLCQYGHDPNLTMSLCTFTTPPLPPSTPPLPPLNANTHAGVILASALSNSMRLQNANIDNLVNECFASLPEMDAFGNGKILGEGGVADQTNNAHLFPMGLSVTSLPAEVNGTVDSTVLEGTKRGSLSLTQRAHNSHITSNKYFFSSFNNVDLLRSMLADCCMPRRQEWGIMAAVGGRRPPWLACVYFA